LNLQKSLAGPVLVLTAAQLKSNIRASDGVDGLVICPMLVLCIQSSRKGVTRMSHHANQLITRDLHLFLPPVGISEARAVALMA
jgi:hypothetical protein